MTNPAFRKFVIWAKSTIMKKIILLTIFAFTGIYTNGQTGNDIKPEKILKKHTDGVSALAFSPDGQVLASGSADKTIILWNTNTWEPGKPLTGHSNSINGLAYLPSGTRLYSGGDYFVRSWKPTGEALDNYRGPTTYIWSIAVKPDSSQFITGSFEKNIKLIDRKTGKVSNIGGHAKSALAVAYSPNGELMASGSLDETIYLWDTKTYKQIDTLKGHGGNIYCVTFSHNGKYLASSSNDNTIRLWEVSTGKLLRTFMGHTNGVLSVVFSPDDNYLVSGSADTNIILWEICNGNQLAVLAGHTNVVNKVAFHPSGEYFASAANDKTIAIWKFSHQLIAAYYFGKEINAEKEQSGLFMAKGKEEAKADFQSRQQKAVEFENQLTEKYYNQYASSIKGVWKE